MSSSTSAANMCRVLIEPRPNSGAWNMAVDEALLEAAIQRRECILRWYRWDQATLSLGYFQEQETVATNPHVARLPTVRRLSGGGAILHHHELTYSCVVPAFHPLAHPPGELYERVHSRLIAVLRRHGVTAILRGSATENTDKPFLCFGRGDSRDVVCQGFKVVGSAQRRRQGAVLQHGSVLLARSEYAPQFPGIFDLSPGIPSADELTTEFAREVAECVAPHTVFADLSETDATRARALERERYHSLEWHKDRRRRAVQPTERICTAKQNV